ncbi:MAG: hypothetical protein D6719_10955, partial [Candidatus Dadabacteria bacterium]
MSRHLTIPKFIHIMTLWLTFAFLLYSPYTALAQVELSSITEFGPEYGGHLEVKGHGNFNSSFIITYEFEGFYVHASRPLSKVLEQGMKNPPAGLADYYSIIPKLTRVSFNASITDGTTFEGPHRNDCWEGKWNVHYSTVIQGPTKEEIEQASGSRDTKPFISPVFIRITDKRPSDGIVTLEISANSLGINDLTRPASGPKLLKSIGRYRFTSYKGPGAVDRTYGAGVTASWVIGIGRTGATDLTFTGTEDDAITPAHIGINFHDSRLIQLEENFDINEPYVSGSIRQTYNNPRRYCSYLMQDRVYEITASYHLGLFKDIEAELKPVENEEKWLPEPGELRKYTLELKNPPYDQVEAVRFRLANISKNYGIATNALNHKRYQGDCHDGTLGVKKEHKIYRTSAHGSEVVRHYEYYNECPIDKLPDLLFSEEHNKDFTFNDETSYTENLKHKLAEEITLEKPESRTVTAVVSVFDGGAHGELHAEVKVGGEWYPAKATGPTASEDKGYLMLPRDKNNDMLHDGWAAFYGVQGADADEDTHSAAKYKGDGLTNFEEQRGLYVRGNFVRTDPSHKTIVVHDYSRNWSSELVGVEVKYSKMNLDLLRIDRDEMKDEIVNFTTTDYKKGDQYAIIIMDVENGYLTRAI